MKKIIYLSIFLLFILKQSIYAKTSDYQNEEIFYKNISLQITPDKYSQSVSNDTEIKIIFNTDISLKYINEKYISLKRVNPKKPRKSKKIVVSLFYSEETRTLTITPKFSLKYGKYKIIFNSLLYAKNFPANPTNKYKKLRVKYYFIVKDETIDNTILKSLKLSSSNNWSGK